MNRYCLIVLTAAGFAASPARTLAGSAGPMVYETSREIFGRGDFDGDGNLDAVIVDKQTGKFRLGYQLSPGKLTWVDCRPSGVKQVAGLGIGKFLAKNFDALAFASAEFNQISMVDASNPTTAARPLQIPFSEALGPNLVLAVDTSAGLCNLFVGSKYNAPDPGQGTLLRNDGANYPKLADVALAGPPLHGNRLATKPGEAALTCMIVTSEKGDALRIDDLSSGKDVAVASLAELPSGSDYAIAHFPGGPLPELLVYTHGASALTVRPLEEAAPGKFQFGKTVKFDLGQPVRQLIPMQEKSGQRLIVIFGEGDKAGIFNFDGVAAPVLVQALRTTNEAFTGAADVADGWLLFAQAADQNASMRYYSYKTTQNTYAQEAFGALPTLADNDNITIPEIHARILANCTVTNEADMRPYTNTIPGTKVTFALMPIPGGEFIMGSPGSEPKRKPDEGPLHKVRVSPFWMGKYEVTWNEYELFMYPDEEQRMRETIKTDEASDKLADAVTHPSKPYTEMSFGMGKDGFPAISMTQHAANKYCQWLSAKTGEFYRLPTEAEWEYACRAGTTNEYFFGNDETKLADYAWYSENSEFKYQKVGKKRPNPWGLYDIYGNVMEWVLDQYEPNYYKSFPPGKVAIDPWNKATKPYPHSARGGSWFDDAELCRSAARRGSERAWKMQDPQLPKSYWFLSDAQWVGFRLVRPLKVPPPEQLQKYWTSGTEKD